MVLSRQHVACASSLLNARSSHCCRLLDCSYELGSGKVHEDGSGSGGSGGATGSIANTELEGEVGRVREDLVKIQEMLLLFRRDWPSLSRAQQLQRILAFSTTWTRHNFSKVHVATRSDDERTKNEGHNPQQMPTPHQPRHLFAPRHRSLLLP